MTAAAPRATPASGWDFTPEDIRLLSQNLHVLDSQEQAALMKLVDELEDRLHVERCRDDLLTFVKHINPNYMVGAHHRQLATLLMQLEKGEKDRITVSIAPRHGKTMLASLYFTAWYIGRNPTKQIMMISHTEDFASGIGRDVRNLVASDAFRAVFPMVSLASDSKAAGRWNTNQGGKYFAAGVGTGVAGRGADLLLIDDAHNEQDIKNGNYASFDEAYKWYTTGARTRLMKDGCVAIVGTRWHEDDLIGRVIRSGAANPEADQFEVFEFPAIMEIEDPETGRIVEKALWPEMFTLEALKRTRAGMPTYQWNAQYLQNPTSEEAAVIDRGSWKMWPDPEPPKCTYIIIAMDTAAETHNRADFTAMAVFGVFLNEKSERHELILLDAVKRRMEFPEMKAFALEKYRKWKPDAFIVEKKNSGTPLYQEMRRTGLIVQEYTPHRGSGDKLARLNSVADIVLSGLVWVPDTRWAEELVDEVASFPVGRNDDLVDVTVMCLTRFRNGGFIRLPSDEPEPKQYFKANKRRGYFL